MQFKGKGQTDNTKMHKYSLQPGLYGDKLLNLLEVSAV